MFIELVETLRCVREHEESRLVAAIDELRERSIRAGKLGCPVCGAEYPIVDGVADFSGGRAVPARSDSGADADASEIALSAGAFLGLGEAAGIVVLGGEWTRGAGELAAAVDVKVFAVNAQPDVEESPSVALLRIADAIPLGARSCAGAALDASVTRDAVLSAQKVVRSGGRLVGPKTCAVPDGMTVIAEDDRWWIAENPPEVTTLRRGNR